MPSSIELEEVRRILREWDPIGVFREPLSSEDDPWSDDEYDSYAPRVFAYLESKRGVMDLFRYLESIRVVQMGLQPDPETDLAAAKKFFEWYASKP